MNYRKYHIHLFILPKNNKTRTLREPLFFVILLLFFFRIGLIF